VANQCAWTPRHLLLLNSLSLIYSYMHYATYILESQGDNYQY